LLLYFRQFDNKIYTVFTD